MKSTKLFVDGRTFETTLLGRLEGVSLKMGPRLSQSQQDKAGTFLKLDA